MLSISSRIDSTQAPAYKKHRFSQPMLRCTPSPALETPILPIDVAMYTGPPVPRNTDSLIDVPSSLFHGRRDPSPPLPSSPQTMQNFVVGQTDHQPDQSSPSRCFKLLAGRPPQCLLLKHRRRDGGRVSQGSRRWIPVPCGVYIGLHGFASSLRAFRRLPRDPYLGVIHPSLAVPRCKLHASSCRSPGFVDPTAMHHSRVQASLTANHPSSIRCAGIVDSRLAASAWPRTFLAEFCQFARHHECKGGTRDHAGGVFGIARRKEFLLPRARESYMGPIPAARAGQSYMGSIPVARARQSYMGSIPAGSRSSLLYISPQVEHGNFRPRVR
nr:hypothetical protein CFP56_79044 [Quercus suber]